MAKSHPDIQRLNARHFKILELCLLGWMPSQIAKHLEMTRCAVSIIVNSPSFQHQLAMRRKAVNEGFDKKIIEDDLKADEILKQSARDAASKLVGHLANADDKISIRAAESILDRSGCPKQTVQKGAQHSIGVSILISDKEANRLVEAIELTTEDNKEQAETDIMPGNDLPTVDQEKNTSRPVPSSQEPAT